MEAAIDISWIRQQIKDNPGQLAYAWKRLIEMWDHRSLVGDRETVDDIYDKRFIHNNPAEVERFFKE